MQRIRMDFDPAIEAKGYDKMRSRLEVMLTNGRKLVREADERYRGGPDNPLSDEEIVKKLAEQGIQLSDDELVEKFTDCTQSMLNQAAREKIIEAVFGLEKLTDIRRLIDLVATT